MDNFEKHIKNTIDNTDYEYDSNIWNNINAEINKSSFFTSKYFFISLISVVVISSVVYFYINNNNITEEKIPQSENNIQNNNINNDNNSSIINITSVKKNKNSTSHNSDIIKDNINTKKSNINLQEAISIDSLKGIDINKFEHIKLSNKYITLPESIEESTILRVNIEKKYCSNQKIIFYVENPYKNLKYLWYIDNKQISDLFLCEYDEKTVGSHNIRLDVMKENVKVNSYIDKFEVIESPDNDINITEIESGIMNKYTFNCESEFNIIWEIEGNKIEKNRFDYQFTNIGNYKITAQIENDGCVSTKETFLNVKQIYNITNEYVFSPNNDSKNDYFLPFELLDLKKKFELRIYNNKGREVFYSNTINDKWDGKDKTGKNCEFGIYIIKLKIYSEKNNTEDHNSSLLLIGNK